MTTESDQTTTQTKGVTGAHTIAGVPHGRTSITPFLALVDPAGAIDSYEQAFAARICDVTEMDGRVVHAEIDFGNGRLQLGVVNPGYGLVPMPNGDGDCYSLGLYCEDVDALVARSVALGATIREELTTFVSGDRFASIRDPYGVRWSVMSRVEDLSDDESAQRVAQWAATQHFGR